jgi:hypothetical protein
MTRLTNKSIPKMEIRKQEAYNEIQSLQKVDLVYTIQKRKAFSS